MIYEKRVVSSTIWGVIFGFVCWGLLRISGTLPAVAAVSVILYMSLLGFIIGISAWKLPWWLHGGLLGLFFSLPSGFAYVWAGAGWGAGFAMMVVAGVVFGVLIEFITSVLFGAKMREEGKEEERKEKEEEREG